MAIKGAKTIAEYHGRLIGKWLDDMFDMNCLKVEYMDDGSAKITDDNGDTAYAVYRAGQVGLVDELEEMA